MTGRSLRLGAAGLAAAFLALGCGQRGGAPARERDGGERVHNIPSSGAAIAHVDSEQAARNATREPGALETVTAGPVAPWKGPGGKPFEVALRTADPTTALARKFGTITLQTSARARAPDLGQYPCTSCHLGRKITLAEKRIPDAHQNIKPQHPRQTGGACKTCHAPDNVELLALQSGERATLDHTYRVCAQCHFAQANAWAGGGHGKRLDGWQGRRVLMGCADCHDPHKPALERRIPFRAPVLARPRADDQ